MSLKLYIHPILLLIITLGGCSSNSAIPSKLPSIDTKQAAAAPAKYKGTTVYWGGTIIKVNNFKDYSLIEILKRPLSGSEPNDLKKAQGRFIAKVSGFIDPVEYKTPSRVTITGTLQGIQKGKVGHYPYTYPIIQANQLKFWQGKKAKPTNAPYWLGYPHHYNRHYPYYYQRGYW